MTPDTGRTELIPELAAKIRRRGSPAAEIDPSNGQFLAEVLEALDTATTTGFDGISAAAALSSFGRALRRFTPAYDASADDYGLHLATLADEVAHHLLCLAEAHQEDEPTP